MSKMILIDEATAKLALEALEGWGKGFPDNWGDLDTEAVTAIREALAEQLALPPECQTEAEKTAFAFGWFKALETVREQPPQQEPVAAQSVMTVRIWRDKNSDQNAEFKNWHKLPDGEHILYTSPPAQPAQRKPLTDEQKELLAWLRSEAEKDDYFGNKYRGSKLDAAADMIEAAHGITGEHK